jgi:hypothetical protein
MAGFNPTKLIQFLVTSENGYELNQDELGTGLWNNPFFVYFVDS